jgi:hypothetical protein
MATRPKVRVIRRTDPAHYQKGEGETKMTAEVFLDMIENGHTVKEVADKLTDSDMLRMVDYGYERDQEKKEIDKEVKVVKDVLMEYGRQRKVKKMAGSKADAVISAASSTETGTPTELAKLLKLENKIDLFDELVSVRLGDLKKYLGEAVLKDHSFIKKVESDEYGKIGFKARKK